MGSAVGGGEVLKYFNQTSSSVKSRLNEALIGQFRILPYVELLAVVLIIVIALYFIMHTVRVPLKRKGIKDGLSEIDKIKKTEAQIIRKNNIIYFLTNLIERTPLALNKSYNDYWKYNLKRANVRIPGGNRIMEPKEFNALVKIITIITMVLNILVVLFVSSSLGFIMIILGVVICSNVPMLYIRSKVSAKDLEISANFPNLYIMIHYNLIEDGSTPLSGLLKSYAKTTNSEEMQRFVDTCILNIDVYGEYEATEYISKEYKEIPEITKLMRLIKQSNENGDIKAELEGFKDSVLDELEYSIEVATDKQVAKAERSFNILVPILVQAILSAMLIYLKDLGLVKGLLG